MSLAPVMVLELVSVIQTINGSGVGVLLVEQNVFLALQVAHRGYVLEVGKVILEGDIEQFKDSELVKRAYLGE
jgi:branched-chain amino acid transport system ATP-binding protein